jgi:LuxR family maltose regulon positive regulatory protein
MMKFSLATELDTRLVRDLAEDDPDKVLDRLESPGLLERHYRGEHIVLTMPTLVRELLREAYLARDAAAARTFHARLARWYAGHEGPDNDIIAVEHAVAGQDWRLVHEIWSEHGVRLGVVHRDRLRVALNSIPAETMTTYPGMQVTQLTLGRQPVDGQPAGWIAQTRTYAEISTRVLSRQRDVMPVADLIYTGTGHMVGLRLLGKFAESEKFARQVKAQTGERMTTEEPTGDRLGWFYLHRAITQTLVGDDDTAIRYYHRAWEHHLGSRATYLFAYVAANLAMTHVLRGEARTGQAWLEQYNAIEPTGTPADYLVGIGARDAAQSELAQLDDRSTATELWPFVAYLQAQYRLQFGHPGNALVSLDAGRAVYPPELTSSGAAALLLTRARADLLIVAEQGQRAGQLLDAYVAGTATADRTVLAVPRIRLRLLAGDNAAVLSMIGSFTAEQPTRVHDNLELLLLAAVAALRIGDSSGALRIMAHVPDVYEESRNLRAFATIPAAQREELFKLSGIELTPEEAATLRAHPEVYPAELILITLTKRENALLLALRAHASRQAIAEALYVSPNTVKTQIAGLYRKLGTTNRQDALIRAQELGLLS